MKKVQEIISQEKQILLIEVFLEGDWDYKIGLI